MEVSAEFTSYRRNLPHWQVGGSTYFVTFRSLHLLSESSREIVIDRTLFGHGKKFDLFFGVVMPDHVHVLLQPLPKASGTWYGLGEILQGIKGASAHDVNRNEGRSGPLWQTERFDRIIRNEMELREKWEYMWNNPIKAGLSDGLHRYRFYIEPPSTLDARSTVAG